MPHSNDNKTGLCTKLYKVCLYLSLTVLFFLPVLAIKLYIANYPLRWGNVDETRIAWERKTARKTHEPFYKVVVLGDSDTNAAFAPELLGENVLDFALHGAAPIDLYYAFKEYLSHNPPPEYLYVAFYPWHFRYIRNVGTFNEAAIMVRLFDFDDEIGYIGNVMKYEGNAIGKLKRYLELRLYLLPIYWVYLKNSAFNKRIQGNKLAMKKQDVHRGTVTTRTVWEHNPRIDTILEYLYGVESETNSFPKNWNHFTVSASQDFYYRKLLNFCRKKGIFIRVLALPQMYANYGQNYWNEFQSYHDDILTGYENWTLDTCPELMSAGASFSAGDWADAHHMNNHGSLKFSRMIRARYPEDFAEGLAMSVSDNTLAGLEDYISMENRADMILQWIQGAGGAHRNIQGGIPLSALFITRNGHRLEEDWMLAAVLQEEYPEYAKGRVELGEDAMAFYFTGDGHAASISASGPSSVVILDGGQAEEIAIPEDGADLFVLVFNKRTGAHVSSKSFRFTGWSYKLLS